MKKFSFIILAFIIFTTVSELIFSTFFFLKTGYSGPIFKVFMKNEPTQENIILRNVKIDKKTQKMIPGNYLINDIKNFINSKGFRGENFKKENINNCRIISLGGSITFGVEKSYPKELEKLINKNISKKCESLNFGITSKGLNYVENLFNNEVIEYSPNIVTIMANRNSTMYDSYGSGSKSPGIISNKKEFYYYKIHSFLFSNIMTYRFIDLATKRLIFISTSDDGKIANPDNPNLKHSINYFKTKYYNQLVNIAILSKKNKIKLVLIKEPYYLDIKFQQNLNNLNSDELLERLINYNEEKYNNKRNLFWIYTNALLNNYMDKIKEDFNEVIIVDPTQKLYSMEKEKNFLKDGNHLNNNGHIILAEEIYRKIKNKL